MKVIIAGGREYSDYENLQKVCNFFLQNLNEPIEIVCGMQEGADSLGKRYGEERGLFVHEFPANWKKFGRRAGPLRNEEMAKFSDSLIAFWDGTSPGTRSMIKLAKKHGLRVKVHKYEKLN